MHRLSCDRLVYKWVPATSSLRSYHKNKKMASTSVVMVIRHASHDQKDMMLEITEDDGSSAGYKHLHSFYGVTSLGIGEHEYIVEDNMSRSFILLNYKLYPVPKMWKCKLPEGDNARFLHLVINGYRCMYCEGYSWCGTELTELPEEVKLYCEGNLEHNERSARFLITIGYESFDVLSEKQLDTLRQESKFGSDIIYRLQPLDS